MLRQTYRSQGWYFAVLLGVSTVSALALCNAAQAKDFDVKKYGATGDGTTDDSTAIAAAITAAEQTNVNSDNFVVFPAGKYLIGPASPVLAIKGIGLKGAAVIKPTPCCLTILRNRRLLIALLHRSAFKTTLMGSAARLDLSPCFRERLRNIHVASENKPRQVFCVC